MKNNSWATPVGYCGAESLDVGTGFSQEYEKIKKIVFDTKEAVKGSFNLNTKENTKQDVASLVSPIDDESEFVTLAAVEDAMRFIEVFPEDSRLKMPSIMDDGENGVAFEWSAGNRNIFVINLKGDGKYIYAGLTENGELHGIEALQSKEIPSFIIENIRHISKF